MTTPLRLENGVQFEPRQIEALGLERLLSYAAASGDHNPIHIDPVAARQAGFPEAIVHGTLLSAFIAEFLAVSAPGTTILSQKLRFLAPIPASRRLSIGARIVKVIGGEHREHAIVRVMINTEDGGLAAMAEVELERDRPLDRSAAALP